MPQVERPDVRAFLAILNQTPMAALEKLGPKGARALTTQMREGRPEVAHDLSVVRDLECPGPAGPIALRYYDLSATCEPTPVAVYFHGGGFVLGDLDSHHQICVDIATQVGVPVLSVNYRLAPEYPFPAAPDDAEAATRWIATAGTAAIGREFTSLILAGDSAGANLAAVTASALRQAPGGLPVAAQFLIYPTIGNDRLTGSRDEFAEGHFLTKASIEWFNACYAAPEQNTRFDLLAADLNGTPPTLLVTAGLDPLRDEGREYAAALIKAGVEVVYQEASGNIHGFFGAAAVIPSVKDDVRKALGALREMLVANRTKLSTSD
jgi:acetyl esterase